jgi:hypothetical protein
MGMRYIDPYQLADKVAESMRDNPHEGKIALNHRLEHEHFLRMIALAPDADVEPVVHGWWIKKAAYNDGVLNTVACSVCNTFQPIGCWDYYNYCPHCGAKMEVKVEHCDD